jgi:hypothetical protein
MNNRIKRRKKQLQEKNGIVVSVDNIESIVQEDVVQDIQQINIVDIETLTSIDQQDIQHSDIMACVDFAYEQNKELISQRKINQQSTVDNTKITPVKIISMVVVTYHNDFLLLERFLKSVYDNWNPAEIDKICVILNDTAPYYREFDALIKRNTNKHFKLTAHYAYELEPKLSNFGWNSQQLLKCLSYTLVDTEWYIIHDCKDYYSEPLQIRDAFNDQWQAIMKLDHARWPNEPRVPICPGASWSPGPFSLALKMSYTIFDLDYQDYNFVHFPSGTPFIVKTEIMKDMVTELRAMMKGFFHLLFSIFLDGQLLVTEFLLYGAYCNKKHKWNDYVDWSSDVKDRKFYNAVLQSKDLRTSEYQFVTPSQRTQQD